ncbi:hypothetical protein Tco_0782344 [Tanacetum coccineum]
MRSGRDAAGWGRTVEHLELFATPGTQRQRGGENSPKERDLVIETHALTIISGLQNGLASLVVSLSLQRNFHLSITLSHHDELTFIILYSYKYASGSRLLFLSSLRWTLYERLSEVHESSSEMLGVFALVREQDSNPRLGQRRAVWREERYYDGGSRRQDARQMGISDIESKTCGIDDLSHSHNGESNSTLGQTVKMQLSQGKLYFAADSPGDRSELVATHRLSTSAWKIYEE